MHVDFQVCHVTPAPRKEDAAVYKHPAFRCFFHNVVHSESTTKPEDGNWKHSAIFLWRHWWVWYKPKRLPAFWLLTQLNASGQANITSYTSPHVKQKLLAALLCSVGSSSSTGRTEIVRKEKLAELICNCGVQFEMQIFYNVITFSIRDESEKLQTIADSQFNNKYESQFHCISLIINIDVCIVWLYKDNRNNMIISEMGLYSKHKREALNYNTSKHVFLCVSSQVK